MIRRCFSRFSASFLATIVLGLISAGGQLVAAPVEVTRLAGPPVTGELQELSAERITVVTATGPATIDIRQVLQLKLAGTSTPPPADVTLELADGSRIGAASFTLKSGKATVGMGTGEPLSVRSRSLRAVRLRKPQAEVDNLWRTQLETPATGDLLIIRKQGKGATDSPTGIVLDRQAGIIQEVTDAVVQFELDGDRIPVKREKLEGIVFFQNEEREWPDTWCRLEDSAGSIWVLKALRLRGESCEVDTVAGLTATLPLASLRKLDFSVGNTSYLSDLEPDSVEWIPFFESAIAGENLARRNQPRRDRGFDGGRLQLGGQSFDKGIALRSRSTMVFRIPKGFNRLVATVGIDDRVRENGHVQLVIQSDSKVIFSEPITGRDRPRELDLDLTGAKRVTVLVDFGQELDVADFLNLCNARFTK